MVTLPRRFTIPASPRNEVRYRGAQFNSTLSACGLPPVGCARDVPQSLTLFDYSTTSIVVYLQFYFSLRVLQFSPSIEEGKRVPLCPFSDITFDLKVYLLCWLVVVCVRNKALINGIYR